MPFSVRITVRTYEIDTQGHVNGAVYHQYADHARAECLRAAGISVNDLLAGGVGPVTLENTIRYHRELRAGDEVEVTCDFVWGEGKTSRVVQEFRRPDGTLVAEVIGTGGLLDLAERRLVPDPGARWRALAKHPEVLNL
ncbi:MAG TPA: acyl-CoA thioesterase [Thermomonospora sp.]|nr:acyl-CoA thioesterase [Thermomonospora sp.]